MIQSQPRRPPSAGVFVILGFLAGGVAEFAMVMVLDYTVTAHTSVGALNAIAVAISVVNGAIVGGVMFLGRPRDFGLAVLTGVLSVVAGIIADQFAILAYGVLHHYPIEARLFIDYFTHARAIFWISDAAGFAAAAGLTALRIATVRSADRRGAGTPPPPYPYGSPPPYGPPSPYGPPPPNGR